MCEISLPEAHVYGRGAVLPASGSMSLWLGGICFSALRMPAFSFL